jgi:hypothetical protein
LFFAASFWKEVKMFETLMKSGSYRVDYFKDQAVGSPQALGFYACGDIPSQATFSQTARHNLLAGFIVIQHHFSISNLVAIYLDVHASQPQQAIRPAYEQMKRDLRAGLFKRAFVFSTCRLNNGQDMLEDLCQFCAEIDGFELITFANGAPKKLLPCKVDGINLESPVLA